MSLYVLNEVEAFRAQVLLEEALKKLNFLQSISTGGSGGDELTQFMGDEISRIIQTQRDLERRYEELIAQRGKLKGLCNKAVFKETQQEIQTVANQLKESNKNLCRNLKENPNVQGNLLKMQAERAQVQEWLEETKSELLEKTFQSLVSKVEAEKKEQDRLNDIRKKEKEASQAVKQLEAELQREYADHEKETKTNNQQIKELKEELQQNRTISDIEFKFEEKKLRAREQALLRIHAQMHKKLEEEYSALLGAQELETTVHKSAQDFLESKVESLQQQKEQWNQAYDKEIKDREDQLTVLKDRREKALDELTELEEKRAQEAEEYKLKENEMRNAVLIERQRRDQMQRMANAILFLQEEGRRYMERMAARKAASKGKKKKGKKK
jgi:myosin heavy subunit